MATFRALDDFISNFDDPNLPKGVQGSPEIRIGYGMAYSDGDKRIKYLVERFPDKFEAEAPR